MVKLIIFDSDGVLCKNFDMNKYNVFIKDFLKKHGLSEKLIKKQNKIWGSVFHEALTGKISHREANAIWLEKLGLPKRLAKEFLDGDYNFWKIAMKDQSALEVKETLRKLKSMGYKLAALSNDVRQNFLKKKVLSWPGVAKYLDAVYTSHSIGHAKPEKEAYLHVVRQFMAKPRETIFVGHEDYEIEGAKKAGLKVVCFRSSSHPLADFHIRRFSEILRIVE